MEDKTAVVIIDTGFSLESIMDAKRILAVLDLSNGFSATGEPFLVAKEILERFSGDPLNHGSLVLKSLMRCNSDLPVVLIRAYSDDVRLIRTEFSNGQVSRFGWVDGYRLAVEFLKGRGYKSVTNCSFGGYTHAMDGSGWEAHMLRSITGPGRSGHIVVAGAGSGSGVSIHASWSTAGGESSTVIVAQNESTTYNLWEGLRATDSQFRAGQWTLEVRREGEPAGFYHGGSIPLNLWNNRRQLTFHVPGKGEVELILRSLNREDMVASFDCWINHQDDAVFVSHHDPMLIAEPAIFPEVVAVGLKSGCYSLDQEERLSKPEVMLDGDGPVSFRLPEVVSKVAEWLDCEPGLDCVGVKEKLRLIY